MLSLENDAIELLEKGFSVIPVQRNKKPFFSWEEYQRRLPTEEEICSWWKKYPDANIAIITGKISNLVVVDVDTKEGINHLKKNFPVSPVHVKSGRGWHRYFRHPQNTIIENAVNVFPGVDIRGDGGYVLAPPSKHPSGAIYNWVINDGGWDCLPVFHLNKKGNLSDLNFESVKILSDIDYTGLSAGEGRNNKLAKLIGKWLSIGYPYDIVELLAQGWNLRNDPPLPQKEVKITLNSIYKADLKHSSTEEKKDNVVIENKELVEIVDVFNEDEILRVPDAVLHPGGFLEDFMEYVENSVPVSSRIYNLGAGIALLGTLVGQKFKTPTGLRTNFYCIGIGNSGTGKDSPQKAIAEIMMQTKASVYLGANQFTSDTAILSNLLGENIYSEHIKIFILDEIGLLLSAIKDKNSYKKEVQQLLMTLLTSADRHYQKSYGDRNNDIYLPYHHLSLYGATTQERFWENMTRTDTVDGFLSRFLFFPCDEEQKKPKLKLKKDLPSKIITFINSLVDLEIIKDSKNNLENKPIPRETFYSEETEKVIEDWTNKVFDLSVKHSKIDSIVSSIYQRVAENMFKLSLCFAISSFEGDIKDFKEIPLESVKLAILYMEWHTKRLIADMKKYLVESEFHRKVNKVISVIKTFVRNNKGKAGASEAYINSHVRGLTKKEVRDVLEKLLVSGEAVIQKYKSPKGGREVDLYVLSILKEDF